ncbi:MAG: hypothetical protein JSW54_12640 [Fidelibacterota bacterium]|nr:MAG: hypothetical protein JSW54_12640 [Candidatus Neomarinimicrobiota bacterium]
MRRCTYVLAMISFLGSSLSAQENDTEPAVGYLRIFTDTDLVQIYVDGEMIGYTPILEKIPVTPGWHNVSFFSPDFKWSHWTHRQRKVLMNVVEAGTYNVMVEPGELTEVQMAWHDLERELERYESGRTISAIVGLVMVATTLVLLALVS